MKRLRTFALVLATLCAGFAGSMLHHHLQPKDAESVEAQARPRATQGVRIAIINLEEAARQSSWFKQLKIDWERAQKDVVDQQEKTKRDYQAKIEEYRRDRNRGESRDKLQKLETEIKALEEVQKEAAEAHRRYLTRLMNEYQTRVLKKVMNEIDQFVSRVGYDIVLQDYTVNVEDADFFSGPAYAQTMMSKPVLHVPSINNKNQYVTDITQTIIDRIKDAQIKDD